MALTPPWLEIAQDELGVREIPGRRSARRIEEYHGVTLGGESDDSVPWCSSFTCWCLGKAGYSHPASKRARSFLLWGIELPTPAHGCVAVFARGHGPQPGREEIDAPGHTGFVVGEAASDELLILSGNQSDRVCIRPYPVASLLRCAWVAGVH